MTHPLNDLMKFVLRSGSVQQVKVTCEVCGGERLALPESQTYVETGRVFCPGCKPPEQSATAVDAPPR